MITKRINKTKINAKLFPPNILFNSFILEPSQIGPIKTRSKCNIFNYDTPPLGIYYVHYPHCAIKKFGSYLILTVDFDFYGKIFVFLAI